MPERIEIQYPDGDSLPGKGADGAFMSSGLADVRWYALHVRSHCEKSVASSLHEYGQEVFLPLYQASKHDFSSSSSMQVPLFPGYIFCRIDWQKGLKLYLIPGIISVVGMGKKPLPIDDSEIESIRRIENSRAESKPCAFGKPGAHVRIVKGPLVGIEGTVQRPGANEIVVSISLLQRSVAVRIDQDWLVAIEGAASDDTQRLSPLNVVEHRTTAVPTNDFSELLVR